MLVSPGRSQHARPTGAWDGKHFEFTSFHDDSVGSAAEAAAVRAGRADVSPPTREAPTRTRAATIRDRTRHFYCHPDHAASLRADIGLLQAENRHWYKFGMSGVSRDPRYA